jgi:ParB-like chromosome segregation protein Spo0J
MLKEVDIKKLRKAEYNPRVELEAGMKDYDALKASIEQFGQVEPIVWNKTTGNVVGGHQRLTVLQDLGYTKALCCVVELDENEEKVLNLALNKIKGEWDYEKLEDVLNSIPDRLATGFTADELSILLAANEGGITEDFDFSDWDDDDDSIYGAWVVTLKFRSNLAAGQWADSHGYEGQVKAGTSTTVIKE